MFIFPDFIQISIPICPSIPLPTPQAVVFQESGVEKEVTTMLYPDVVPRYVRLDYTCLF